MSQVRVSGNASGTGILTVTSPNTNSNYTLTLPANTGTLLSSAYTGTVLQVLQTVKTDAFSTSSATMVDVTGLSVSITPSSASNKILVFVNIWICGGTSASAVYYNLVRNSTGLGVSTAGSSFNTTGSAFMSSTVTNNFVGNSFTYLDSPATTSATTYKIQLASGTGADTVYINRRTGDAVVGGSSVITVMEIAG